MNIRQIQKFKKSSALLFAVSILAVIFIMAMLVSFNSSQELDQTTQALYRSMCLQLAEAACEEASGILTADKANVAWRVGIYEICTTSDIGLMGSRSSPDLNGANPFVGGDIVDMCKNTKDLCENFAGHFGKFNLESVSVTLRQVQPIIYPLAFMKGENFYRPKDRGFTRDGGRPFVTEPKKQRDWQGQFEIFARVSYRGVRATMTIHRDLKVVNVSPMARQYSLFSTFGPENENDVKNDLNDGGMLFINNNKYKGAEARLAKYSDDWARVYLRGPYQIKVQANTPYSRSRGEKLPDDNIAYDQDGPFGYKGWSVMPEPRSLWDLGGTGHIPTEENKNLFFDIFKGIWKGGESYYRGSVEKQKFVPSAFSLLGRPRGPLNSEDAHFDNNPESYTLEHFWDHRDKKVEKEHAILGVYKKATIWPGTISFGDEVLQEFRFSMIKPSWWKDLLQAIKRAILPLNPLITLGKNVISWVKKLFGKDGFNLDNIVLKNTLPVNYKNFKQCATRIVPDLSWLYAPDDPNSAGKDESKYIGPDGSADGSSYLPINGVYWVTGDCVIDKETTYSGKGMLISSGIDKPLTVSQSIQPPAATPAGEILSLVYHPQGESGGAIDFGNSSKDQLYLKGKSLFLNQISLFSIHGIKSDEGSKHYLNGNYVNWFMKKSKLRGDLYIDYPMPTKFTLFREEDNNDVFLMAGDYATSISPVLSYYYAR